LLLNAVLLCAAVDRYLLPGGRTTANPPLLRAAAE